MLRYLDMTTHYLAPGAFAIIFSPLSHSHTLTRSFRPVLTHSLAYALTRYHALIHGYMDTLITSLITARSLARSLARGHTHTHSLFLHFLTLVSQSFLLLIIMSVWI